MGLPGVKVGPLDPDSTSGFGQVSAANSARTLIRLHRQQNPPELVQALARPRDDEHSKAALENIDLVQRHVDGLTKASGDRLIPEGAVVNGAAVRGDRIRGQVLTFTYELPSGRVGTWHTPYSRDVLPEIFDDGESYRQAKVARERGVTAFDEEGTRAAILERHNRELTRQVEAFKAESKARGEFSDAPLPEGVDPRDQATIAADLTDAQRQNEELKARLAEYEALFAAQGGGVPTAGTAETVVGDTGAAAEEPPLEGYDSMKADEVVNYLKADERTREEREAIVAYEKRHSNRRTVVSQGEQLLDTTGPDAG